MLQPFAVAVCWRVQIACHAYGYPHQGLHALSFDRSRFAKGVWRCKVVFRYPQRSG